MQPQYGQPVYIQQQPYPGTYQPQQGGYYQQPVMVQPGYGQQQVLVETVMIAQEVPQGYPAGQMGMGMGMNQQRYLPNNANGCEYTTRIQCPSCQKEVNTIVENKSGGAVYGWVAITCLCCFPFCCIPLFIDSCKDKVHKCPSCQAEVGINQKSMC
ncbi:LITAF-like zinc ribbon domain protein (macronuclear) [Tetrahymena thermophila SB210]|uniref:LITAF-like zinc ribbon domain protein n=1 Tax=Tetrahymena thermophila (strain SB210) TaxID=312017 RepID=Q23YW6_TETTS|nr:LITAF-like zinc ribbon domain protein [Tetrahymena thermophila SB210]EAS01689.2 LITAF-like zinc ribbon domain protein [Tetrahymena thermophila SB210]|eukprot:XP_001021934.2 LITAF-like zinc ribbon domain protein [Tetrahymena thermophila SB210]